MNKIFKLKKGSHGLKVVSEIAKSHSGEKAVTNGFGGSFGGAFARFADFWGGSGADAFYTNAGFSKVALSLATAIALGSAFMPTQAQADVWCQNNTTGVLTKRVGTTTCQSGETIATSQVQSWGSGKPVGVFATAWGGAMTKGEFATAWGGFINGNGTGHSAAYAGIKDTAHPASINVHNVANSKYDGKNAVLRQYIDGNVIYNENTNGRNATAWGGGYTANNNTNYDARTGGSVALGQGSTAWGGGYAIGDYSTAFGAGAFSAGSNSTAWSRGKAIGSTSTAWGRAFATGNNATAWGNSTVLASGNNSTAFGNGTRASASQSVAWGMTTEATDKGATAWGSETFASGTYATAFGSKTQANSANSVAWGQGSIVKGKTYTASDGKTYRAFKLMEYADTISKGSTQKQYYIIGIDTDGNEKVLYGREGDTSALSTYTGTTFGGQAFDTMENTGGKFANWIINNVKGGNDAKNSTAFGAGSEVYAENALGALGGIVGEKGQTYGQNSAAIGKTATVLSDNAFAFGKDSLINTGSANSVAIGSSAKVGPDAENAFSAVGGHAKSPHSISIGVNSIANGVGSIAFGSGEDTGANMSGSYANSNGAIAIGKKAEAGSATNIGVTGESGNLTLPQGTYSDDDGHHYSYARTMTGSGSQMIAIGDNASAYNDQAIAIGGNTAAIGYASISIGGDDIGLAGVRNNETIKYLKDTLKPELETSGFTVSNTLNRTIKPNNGSDKPAFQDITLAQGASSIAFGFKSVAEGDLSNAFGTGARSIGLNSTAFGTFATAWGKESIAFGTATLTAKDANYATAIGYMSQIGENATNSVAVGYKNKVTGSNSTAVGQKNTITGNNSGAFGDPNNISGNGSYAVGNNNTSTTDNTFVLGNNVTNTLENSVYLGKGSTTATTTGGAGLTDVNDATVGGITYSGFAGKKAQGIVSVGSDSSARRIQNVAAGAINANSTDAINGSQLYAVLPEYTTDDAGNVNNIKVGDKNYKVAGATTVTGKGSIKVETKTDKPSEYIVSIPVVANSGGSNINPASVGENANSLAIGDNAKVENSIKSGNSIAIGNNAKVAKSAGSSIVIGNDSVINTNEDMVVIGNNIKTANSTPKAVVIGSGSTNASVASDLISIGDSDTNGQWGTAFEFSPETENLVEKFATFNVGDGQGRNTLRQIKGVANGEVSEDSNDAVTGAQLYSVAVAVANMGNSLAGSATIDGKNKIGVLGKSFTVNTDNSYGAIGTITGNNIADTGKDNIEDAIKAVKTEVTAGDGINVSGPTLGDDGHPIYNVSAKVDNKSVGFDTNGNISVKTDGDTITTTNNGIKVNTGESKVEDGKAAPEDGDENKIATVGDIVDTINNIGWNVGKGADKATTDELVKAGERVGFVEGKSVSITQKGKNFEFSVKLSSDNSIVEGSDGTLGVSTTGTKANDGKAELNPTTGTTTNSDGDTVNVVKDGDTWYEVGADGNPDTTKPVAADKVTPNESGYVKAGDVVETINQTFWKVSANNEAEQEINPSDSVKFEDGDGVSVTQTDEVDGVTKFKFKAKFDDKTIKVNDDGDLYVNTDGDTITTDPSTGGLKVNTGESTTTNGKADVVYKDADGNTLTPVKDDQGNITGYEDENGNPFTGDETKITNSGDKIATVGDIVNTINGTYWVAKDGNANSTNVSPSVEVVWKGGKFTNVELDPSNNTFLVSSTLRFEKGDDGSVTIYDDSDPKNPDEVVKIEKVVDTNTVTALTANGGEKPGETTGNVTLEVTTDEKGNPTYDVALNNEITIGGKGKDGKDGKDGKISVADKDGNDGVTMEAKDGVGTIGLNGKDGASATISVVKDVPGVDGKDGDTMDRIQYEDGDGNTHSVATLDDGLKFEGDYDGEVAKKLNQKQNIKGNHTKGKDSLTDGNIGVVNEGGDLIIKLAKDLDLGKDGSVKTGDTTINNDGITINNPDNPDNSIKITNGDINMGGNQIHNVAAGTDDNDAVNVSQLKTEAAKASNTVSSGDDNIKVSESKNPNGSTNYEVALNKDVTLDKGSISITGDKNNVNITGDKVDVGGNKIENVKAGENPTDAVNVAQLKELVGNYNVENYTDEDGNTYNNVVQTKDEKGKTVTLTTYNVKDKGMYVTNNVVTAISKMNEQGIKFFHTNEDETFNPDVQKTNKVDSSAKGGFATAIGVQAEANGKDSLAIGHGAIASGEQSIAIGTGNKVYANNSGAFGDPNEIAAGADGSYVVGNNNKVSTKDTFVLGNSVTSTVENSLFFGNESAYVADDGARTKGNAKGYNIAEVKARNANGEEVTIGVKEFAGGDEVVGVVSVGNGKQTRRVQNVAPGLISKQSTDAINGSQLYSALEGVSEHLGAQINQTNNNVNNLAQQLGDAKKEYRGGIASAIAIGNLPQSTIPGKGMLSAGVGYFKDEGALSIGLSKMSDNGKWVFKSSLSVDTQENIGAGLSMGFHF